ncbi:efflux RND transporter periplasmic adaptor subunit [Erythrobacter litoralis]|uniref:efflux RND transporter periplasmic adaptor subunit n=1 Tax=Erythrobacter litoralis TaxID=39960 RepID=UPI0024351B74|nr:HlyD family efflux transporter periplasmic adaptor subunit [Erythrobacter litoralis]
MATTQPELVSEGGRVTAVKPLPAGGDAARLAALLQFEAELRRQSSVNELQYFLANELRPILPYEQIFVLRRATFTEGLRIECASSMANVDRNAPLVHALEQSVEHLIAAHGPEKARSFVAGSLHSDEAFDDYPFTNLHWQPLVDRDQVVFGGLLIAREEPMREAEAARLVRVAETASHSWLALTRNQPVRSLPKLDTRKKRWIAGGLAVVLLFPVRLSALAPAEIVAERPFVIAAPFNGRVASIEVPPNSPVKKGQLLIKFDDVRLANDLELAREQLEVARSRLERSTSTAFGGEDETSNMAILQAELEVAQAEFDYASQLADQAGIVAPVDGMALFSDRRDWEGRAVNVGEPIMQVVDPGQTTIRIDLPAAEQMSLHEGDSIKMWLDSQPLWAIDGELQTASFQARQTPAGTLAFALNATITSGEPRIGSRGTAKVYGRWVPLVYSVLRRPMSAMRQFVGI